MIEHSYDMRAIIWKKAHDVHFTWGKLYIKRLFRWDWACGPTTPMAIYMHDANQNVIILAPYCSHLSPPWEIVTQWYVWHYVMWLLIHYYVGRSNAKSLGRRDLSPLNNMLKGEGDQRGDRVPQACALYAYGHRGFSFQSINSISNRQLMFSKYRIDMQRQQKLW